MEKENRHTESDLQQMQSLPLKIKIQMTERRIYDWYDHWQGDVYLSFSGGKDSTVLKHIIDNMGLGIPSVFINSGLEYPEVQRFAMSQPNVTTIRPKMMFPDIIKKYGYPLVSKEVSQCVYEAKKAGEGSRAYRKLFGTLMDKEGNKSKFCCDNWAFLYDAPFSVSDLCCDMMKKAPSHIYERESHRKAIIATMAEESRQRRSEWIHYGCNAFESKRPKSKPLSFWTEQDVLHYIKEKDIPYCSVYGEICVKQDDQDQITFAEYTNNYREELLDVTGIKRTGCMFCMFGCHLEKDSNRFQKMKKTHPRQYEYCIGGGEFVDCKWMPNKQGLGMGYVLDYIGVKY